MLTSNTIKIKHYIRAFFLRASKVIKSRHASVTASQAVKTKIKNAWANRGFELDLIDKLSSKAKRINQTNSLKKKNLFRSEVQLSINKKQDTNMK